MSLVVAKKKGEQIYIVSDSMLTKLNEINSYKHLVIKSIIISPFLCVSFAGNPDLANDAIESYRCKFNAWEHRNIKKIKEHFAECHNKYKDADGKYKVDFIIAFKRPNATHLISIIDGHVDDENSGDSPYVWIGDEKAFGDFQKKINEMSREIGLQTGYFKTRIARVPEGEGIDANIYSNMFEAMTQVIGNSTIESVGAYIISVAHDKNSFRYMDYEEQFTHRLPVGSMIEPFLIPMGTAELGAHNVCLTEGADRRRGRAIAIYIVQANLGILFSSYDGFKLPNFFSNVSPIEFRTKVEREHGFRIRTFYDKGEATGREMHVFLDPNTGTMSFTEFDSNKFQEM